MATKLRTKFVIVTASLLLVVFGLFFIVNTAYNKYWNNITQKEMLDWISDSGVFDLNNIDVETEELVNNITEGENPIVGLHLAKDGLILNTKIIGGDTYDIISEKTISNILKKGEGSYKVGKYLYSYKEESDGSIMLVIMDSSMYSRSFWKTIGKGALIILGAAALLVIIFFLSRFITAPAEQAILREKQFISDASHELKTPLGAISINAQALAAQDKDNLYLNNIIKESERMKRLIERLLTLSKLEEQPNNNHSKISFSEAVEEIALTYESVAFEKGIKYNYNIDKDINISANRDEISELVEILVDNAIKNTEKDGEIFVECHAVKNKALLEVKNTGKGIDEKDIPFVFERFYTTDSSRNSGSFGLGLAIAKSIVLRHKGEISVYCPVENETVFNVKLQKI